MEEIKTGNYIRTEKGIIDKITSVFYDKDGQVDRFLTRNAAIYTEDDKIIKCHEDVLELIEKISAEADRNHLGSVKDFENKIKTILADCKSKLVSSQ